MPRNKVLPTATRRRRGAIAPSVDAGAITRHGLSVAAVGLAILDASTGQARTKPIEGVRLPENAVPTTSGDSYQDGRALLAAGDVPGAIAAFRAALVTAPQSIDALNGIAVAYDRMGRFDVSRAYYDTALAIDPDAALVLNNLGYSLYLQGQYKAAIPLLQRAAASNDNGARATGQRVLTLIAARMRETAIASADTEVETAEQAPPQARIEVATNGEQRLVLGAPAPPRELAARLGDAAPLVMVAKPWTAKDDAIVFASAVVAERARAAGDTASVAQEHAAAPATPPNAPPSAPWPAAPLPGDSPLKAVLAGALAPAPKSARADDPTLVSLIVDAPSGAGASPGAAARIAVAATLASTSANVEDTAAAWLLSPRRDARPAATAEVGHEPQADAGARSFDSDDGDLNAFAARMRGVEPGPTGPVSTAEAVARLEALIRRLRAA